MKITTILNNKSPGILSALGVAGFISAVIMSARATEEAHYILDRMPTNATKREKARALAPVYAPTAAVVLLSTGCIVGSNRIYTYRYGSLLALYSVSERALQRWQNSVLSEVSKNKYEKIKEHALGPTEDPPEELSTSEEGVLFFDVHSGRYFVKDSVETVRRVINDLNEQLYSGEDFVPLNDFYHYLRLDPIKFGDHHGWEVDDGSIKIELTAFLHNNRPCVRVDFEGVRPRKY